MATTVSSNAWSTLTAAEALQQYAPAANTALNELIAATGEIARQPRLAALIRALCGETLALPALLPRTGEDIANWRESKSYSDDERTALAFAEQFSIDVSSLGDDLRAPFLRIFGSAAFAAALTIYIADMTPRLRRVLELLFRPDAAGWPEIKSAGAVDSNPAFQEFIRVVYNMRKLDPVTTELVRLRGARQHQCRLCKSLRAHSALAAGADEQAFEAVDNYADSELSARHKAALALTDAIIWQPAHISAQIVDDIRTHFSPAEAVELVLDIMRNAANKSAVSLAADAPFSEDVQVYDIDEAGNMHFGLEVPSAAAATTQLSA